MAAYKTYEFHGKNARGKPVTFALRLLATPKTKEIAEFLFHEKFPGGTYKRWTSPAAHKYPTPPPTAVKITTVTTTPVRRAG